MRKGWGAKTAKERKSVRGALKADDESRELQRISKSP